jgi:hypothetical protein
MLQLRLIHRDFLDRAVMTLIALLLLIDGGIPPMTDFFGKGPPSLFFNFARSV